MKFVCIGGNHTLSVYRRISKKNSGLTCYKDFQTIHCSIFLFDFQKHQNLILYLAKLHNDTNAAKKMTLADSFTTVHNSYILLGENVSPAAHFKWKFQNLHFFGDYGFPQLNMNSTC